MTKNSGLASSQTLILGAAGIIVAALVAAYGLGVFDTGEPVVEPEKVASEPVPEAPASGELERPAEVAEPSPEADAAVEPEPTVTAEPEAVPAEEAAVPATVTAGEPATKTAGDDTAPLDQPAPPTFDVVRVEPDGNTLIAGVAAGGDAVDILLDRVAVARAEPGPDGKFATFLTLDPSETPRLLSLLLHAGEARIASEDQVIVAPVARVATKAAKETQIAAADPEPAETPEGRAEDTAATATAVTTEDAAQPAQSAGEAEGSAETAETTAAPGEATVAAEQVETPDEPAEPAAPAVLLAGKAGVSVIQPAQSATASSALVLDAISYSDGGAVELTGRGAGGATIRAYLDNTVRATVVIAETGQWTTRLTDVAPGIYTLRIDQVDAAGKVTSRIETPFKREAPENIVAAEAAQAQADTDQGGAAAPIRVVTIQPGNTLWAIAREQYGEGILYVRLFEANRDLIRNPDLIYPGQVFEIPRD